MQQKATGSGYTTNGFDTGHVGTYVAPAGTTLTKSGIHTCASTNTPPCDNHFYFYRISVGAPSTTGATLLNANQTLSADNSIYSVWLLRYVIYIHYHVLADETLTSGTNATYSFDLDNDRKIRRITNSNNATTLNFNYYRSDCLFYYQ